MIRLNLKKEPYWMDLPAGVRIKVRPLSTAIMSAAQSACIKQIGNMREERKSLLETREFETRETDPAYSNATDSDIPDIDDEEVRAGLTESMLIKALARASIIEWEGVFVPEGDATSEINTQTVNDLMDIWFIAQEFWRQYTSSLLLLEDEGKLSGHAVSGTLAAGPNIAKGAMMPTSHAARVKKVR